MKIRKIIGLLAVIALTVTVTASCGSSRKAVVTGAGNAAVQTVGVQTPAVPGEWQNVVMPVRVTLRSPKNVSLSGRVTMIRDSVINLSMRILGMEVATVNVTADSVWIADRFHKYVFSESTGRVLGSHRLTVGQMQDILFGIDTDGADRLTFDNPGGGTPVTVRFGDFRDTPAGRMAAAIDIEAQVGKTPVDAGLQWSPERAEWNNPSRAVSFKSNFRGYTRVTLDDVLGVLRSL